MQFKCKICKNMVPANKINIEDICWDCYSADLREKEDKKRKTMLIEEKILKGDSPKEYEGRIRECFVFYRKPAKQGNATIITIPIDIVRSDGFSRDRRYKIIMEFAD